MFAFRCNTCGHLEKAEVAGERSTPCACSACGAGVSFDTRSGLRKFEPQNWEILAKATQFRLDELGLGSVIKHNGTEDVEPRHAIDVKITDSTKTQ